MLPTFAAIVEEHAQGVEISLQFIGSVNECIALKSSTDEVADQVCCLSV
jgi:hypothetical protein